MGEMRSNGEFQCHLQCSVWVILKPGREDSRHVGFEGEGMSGVSADHWSETMLNPGLCGRMAGGVGVGEREWCGCHCWDLNV